MHVRICALFLCLWMALPAWAGDEDVRMPKPEPIEEVSEPETPAPPPEEFPDLALGDEEEAPKPVVKRPVRKARKAPTRRVQRRAYRRGSTDPDENLNTSRTTDFVRRIPLPDGVLRPAIGTRGYRSTMFAIGAGDRTPGYGIQIEHSFNRMGVGVSGSFLPLSGDRRAQQYSIYNLYGIYRWLPNSISPYIHGGLQYGLGTPISFGLMGGAGVETRFYESWTLLVGYSFHSVAEKGYWGGAIGWMF